jgi:hypothetical protein
MKRLSDRFLQVGVLFALCGMALGVWMGKTGDFVLSPVHAHINLLGWVSMLLYGLFYRAIPSAAEGTLPVVHFWLSLVSLMAMIPLLSMFLLGHAAYDMPLGIVSMAQWLSMFLFSLIVFRATWSG